MRDQPLGSKASSKSRAASSGTVQEVQCRSADISEGDVQIKQLGPFFEQFYGVLVTLQPHVFSIIPFQKSDLQRP